MILMNASSLSFLTDAPINTALKSHYGINQSSSLFCFIHVYDLVWLGSEPVVDHSLNDEVIIICWDCPAQNSTRTLVIFRSDGAGRDMICGICTAWVANPNTRTSVWKKGNANEHSNDERESGTEWGTSPLCVHKALCNPYRWIGLFRSGGRIKGILLWHLRSAPLPLYEFSCQRSCPAHVS